MADARIRLAVEGGEVAVGALGSVDKALERMGLSSRLSSDQLGVLQGRMGALAVVAAATTFAAFVKSSIDAADRLRDLSKSTGVTAEDLAGLRLLAKQTGTDLGGLAKGINKMSVEIGKDPEKFRKLGITAKDNVGAFAQFADVFGGLADINQRNALSQAVFGKSWVELAPALSEGAKNIRATVEQGAALSGVTTQMTKDADEFNDKLAVMSTAIAGVGTRAITPVLPLLNQLADDLLDVGGKAGGAATGFSPLAETLRAVMVLGGNVSFVLRGIGTEIGGMAAQVGTMLDPNRGPIEKWKAAFGPGGIGDMMKADAAKSRAEFDAWEARIMGLGKAAQSTAAVVTGASKAEQAAAAARATAFLGGDKAAKAAESETKLYTSALQALEQQLGKANDQTQVQKTQYQLLSGSLQTLSAAHGKHLLQIAKEIDLKAQWAAVSKAALDYAKELTAEQDRANEVLASFNTTNSEYLQQLEFETGLLGLSAGARERVTAERKLEMDYQRAQIALSGKEIDLLRLKEQYELQKDKLPAAVAGKVSAEGIFANQEEAKKKLDAFFDPAKAQTFGDALKGAFGGAADAAGRLSSVVEAYGIKQAEIDKARAAAGVAYANDSGKLVQVQQAINEKEFATRIGGYADMAGAAKGFFKEGSDGYKTMDGVSKAFHVAQMAMSAIEMGQKAIAAVLNQAGGDPYTAFPRMAAMAAAVGALGFAVGGGFSGGSGNAVSAADRQKAQGTGTVLGDSAAKSASLLNALEAMQDNTFTQLKYSSGMLDALQSIQRSMAGLAQIIFRTNGLTSGNAFGIQEGARGLNATTEGPLGSAFGGFLKSSRPDALFPGLGDKLDNLIGKLWGKVKTSITDSGIGINGSLGDLSQGRGFSQYADVTTTSSSFFGLVKKSSNSTQSRALGQEAADQLASVFAGISTSLQIATTGFGRDADTIAAQLAASVISIPAISLRGLKGAELQEALNAVFSGAADKLARTVSPGFEALQKAGEGYYETVIRASNALATANGWMERLDQKLFGVSTSGAIAAASLADLFGGITEFNAASQQFYNDYFTDAERAAQSTKEMAQALGTVNLALPGSKDELRALAGTLDKNTEAGRKAYAVLLAIAPEFSATAELIAKAAKDTADKLLKAFTTDSIDFAGLRTALAGQTTEVFVSVLGSVFDQLAGRIKAVVDGIANERGAVRDAMLQINQPGMRTRSEIAGDIAGSQIDSPSNARVTGALAALRSSESGQKTLQGVVEKFARGVAYWTEKENTGGPSEQTSLNIGWYTQSLKLWGGYLASANAYLGAAVTEARSAQLSYADALQNFTIDASKAVGRLGKLREETMAYYQAQRQLADLMGNSARGLRDTVRATRIGQLDSSQSLTQKQADFAKNYSLALSTTGAAQAGYADKLGAALPDLNTALMDVARTREEWAIAASGALAQSEKIAALLEANAPKDYAADSLAMLGQIDATLAALDQSSKSAEKIISDAVNAGSDKTANGLRAVLAALTGQAIPAFATGGSFAGGLRVVGENGPELEATGPSRIYNAAQTRNLLGGGGGNTARLEALVEKLTREVEGLRFETRATATHTSTTAGLLKRVTQDGDAITTRVAA